jgi:hypothetical protein
MILEILLLRCPAELRGGRVLSPAGINESVADPLVSISIMIGMASFDYTDYGSYQILVLSGNSRTCLRATGETPSRPPDCLIMSFLFAAMMFCVLCGSDLILTRSLSH